MTDCKSDGGNCFADIWEKFEKRQGGPDVFSGSHVHGVRTIARMFYFHGMLHAKQGHAIKTAEDLAHEQEFCRKLREEAGMYYL